MGCSCSRFVHGISSTAFTFVFVFIFVFVVEPSASSSLSTSKLSSRIAPHSVYRAGGTSFFSSFFALFHVFSRVCFRPDLVVVVTVRSSSAVQIIATIACSFSVALPLVACFRPARGRRCSAETLVFIGGVLMAIYAVLQATSFFFMVAVRDDIQDGGELSCV